MEITDAYPLVHRYTSLSSTAELGLDLARAKAATDGKRIVGVYVAPAEGAELGRAGEAILVALRSDFAGAIGIVLDNDKLATGEPAYNPTAGATVAFPPSAVVAGTLKLVKSGVHQAVRDLDDHLDDARADWLGNVEAHKAIAAMA
ncbi:uncharacterized protein EHS24_002080 [Apiotrichum porosum]|uniref:Uncharacterized protein n=1 Tax=Apiotrichum porosum TaxID=105984 RepID=A0A427XHZ3_9TREE|nr:uncharacterized protein EHS24_002080 [Apiotrichum porosum]RSH78357.1 hypothetical protein EHS24_002080 [Apiotrichum porosum]